jgi:hypothetical protein
MRNFILFIAVALALSACAYSLFINTYPHLKTIRIATFVNRSTQYGVEQDLDESLNADFQKGNLLKIVQNDPDCLLEGEILDYSNKIYSYDANNQVKEYEVKILFKVKLTDLVKNVVIYQEDQLIMSKTYHNPNAGTESDSTQPQKEEDARAEIYKDLYDRLVKNTFQAW